MVDGTVDLDKYFLGHIFRVFRVLHDPQRGIVYAVLIGVNQVFKGSFLPFFKPFYEIKFVQLPAIIKPELTK